MLAPSPFQQMAQKYEAPRGRVLMSMRKAQWNPSQRESIHGIASQIRFRLTARLHDGHIVWRGWFDDREDADAFLYALAVGSVGVDRELWGLPTPAWHPDLVPEAFYDLATVTFLTALTGSNETFTSPADWNDADNSIEVIGGGAGSSAGLALVSAGGGGGGGAYSKITNFPFASPGTTTAIYRIGVAGTAGATSGADGTAGGDTWFNDTAFPSTGTAVGAKGGGAASSTTGGTGGALASGYAPSGTRHSGGNGGNTSGSGSGRGGGGGGGSGGPNGSGANGGSASGVGPGAGGGGGGGGGTAGSANSGGNGGAGGNNSSGAGSGAGGTVGTPNGTAGTTGGGGGGGYNNGAVTARDGGNGGAGTEWDASHGSGGGGGGSVANSAASGEGGAYGAAGGGGGAYTAFSAGAAGSQGIVVLTYTVAGAPSNRRMVGRGLTRSVLLHPRSRIG